MRPTIICLLAFCDFAAMLPIASAQSKSEVKRADFDLISGNPDRIESGKRAFNRWADNAQESDNRFYYSERAACADFELGQHEAAEAKVEKLLTELAKLPQRHMDWEFLFHFDLGQWYLADLNHEPAGRHLNLAWELRRHAPAQFLGIGLSRLDFLRADLLVKLGKTEPRKTLADIERVLRARPALDEDEKVLLADVRCTLAAIERLEADALAAIEWLQKALASLKTCKSTAALHQIAGCRFTLATNYSQLFQFDEAHKQVDEVLKLAEANETPQMVKIKLRIDALHYRATVLLDEALWQIEDMSVDQRLLAEREDKIRTLISEAETYAQDSVDLQQRHHQQSAYHLAVWAQALMQCEKIRGRLAELSRQPDESQRAYGKALAHADRALAEYNKIQKMEQDNLLVVREERARLRMKVGQIDEARAEVEALLPINQRDWLQATQHELLIELETRAGNYARAAEHAAEHRRRMTAIMAFIAQNLTATEQQTLFRRWYDPGFYASLGLALRESALTEQTFEWLLHGKAQTCELLPQSIRRSRENGKTAELLDSLEEQAYYLYGPADKGTQRDKLIRQAEAKRRAAAGGRKVAAENHAGQALHEERTLAEFKQSLRDDEVYIDIMCLRDGDTGQQGYVAWVVTRADGARLVRLGNSKEIEALVASFAGNINAMPANDWDYRLDWEFVNRDEARLREKYLKPLSDSLFTPLRDAVGGRRQWIISPDGPLWNVPWHALLLPSGDYAIQEYTFRYLVSGRDLLARHDHAPRAPGPPLVVGAPNYNSNKSVPEPDRVDTAMQVGPLDGSQKEAELVQKALQRFDPRAQLLLKSDATKDALIGRAPAPRVLYISSHGFFEPSKGTLVVDPFLRCGVMLAGNNHLVRSKQGTLRLPGLLTAAEVLSSDLNGMELAVLNCCETGTGVNSFGQGVGSLRQAFQLAGARAVISTLWAVENEPSGDLMVRFFERLAAGKDGDKAEILAAAQRDLIESAKKARQAGPNEEIDHKSLGHPYYWAAFTLSGF